MVRLSDTVTMRSLSRDDGKVSVDWPVPYRPSLRPHHTPMGFRIQRNPIFFKVDYGLSGKARDELFYDATTRALGMLHFAHRLMLLAAHAAPVGGFTILITAFVKASVRIAHNAPPCFVISTKDRWSTTGLPIRHLK